MNEIVKALKQTKISENGGNVEELTILIGSVYAQAGQYAPPDHELKAITSVVMSDLKERFAMLTMSEVALAFNRGLRGDYGVYYGINVVTFNKWLKSYKQSEERYKAVMETQKEQMKELPSMNEYNRERMRELCLRYFESYKITGDPGIISSTVYQHLQSRGIISHTREMKMQALEEAKKEIILSGRYSAREAVEGVAKVYAMKACLKHFFQDLIDTGVELSELI